MQFDIINQALTNLFVGVAFAVLNLVICAILPGAPRLITVLGWQNKGRTILYAYALALALQLMTSPFFRSLLHSVYVELAWSPYQALFNVLGIILIDLIVIAWLGVRRGAEIGQEQLTSIKQRAAEGLETGQQQFQSMRERAVEGLEDLGVLPEDDHPTKPETKGESKPNTEAERKQRIDDRLKNY